LSLRPNNSNGAAANFVSPQLRAAWAIWQSSAQTLHQLFPLNTRFAMLLVRAKKLLVFPVEVLLVIDRSLEELEKDDQEIPLEVGPAYPVTVFWLTVTSWNG
jgi:hypothetical protein